MAILIVFFQHGKELRYNNFMDVILLNIEVEKLFKNIKMLFNLLETQSFLQ
jgi:hypothetical protein